KRLVLLNLDSEVLQNLEGLLLRHIPLSSKEITQSVILEPEVLAKSAPEMRDTLPFQRIIALSKSRNAELQTLAQELLEDLKILECEV
ncbi:hypothetical protein KIL84_019393, partial [Mauremys mutica]